MWDTTGGRLVRDFVPARNASGSIGLYERIESRFYPNAGTGEFILNGPAVTFDGANLAYDEGVFSTRDGSLTSYTVDGTVTLVGGLTLEFEVGGVGADAITAKKGFVFDSSVTSEKPIVISVAQVPDGFIATGTDRILLAGGSFAAADLAKFRLETMLPLQLAIAEGNLVVRTIDAFPTGSRTLRYIRSTGTQILKTGIIAATARSGFLATD